METLPFHIPLQTGRESLYISDVIARGQFAGDGHYTRIVETRLQEVTGAHRVLLTNSCTSALEICAIVLGLGPGDEVIMPAWTFPSTAFAFMARGAIPVFADIEPENFGLSVEACEQAITPQTKAIVVVHYGGGSAAIEPLMELARQRGLYVVEDAAQSLLASRNGRHLGTFGDLGTVSFHATKNIHCGEGGALLVNHPELEKFAETVRNKGTNRRDYLEGQVSHYSWQYPSTSAMASEISAAFLAAQLDFVEEVTEARRSIWTRYDKALSDIIGDAGFLSLHPDATTRVNGHSFPLVLPNSDMRKHCKDFLSRRGITTAEHYQPLHHSSMAIKLASTRLPVTDHVASGLLRLPLWPSLTNEACERVILDVRDAIRTLMT